MNGAIFVPCGMSFFQKRSGRKVASKLIDRSLDDFVREQTADDDAKRNSALRNCFEVPIDSTYRTDAREAIARYRAHRHLL